MSDSWPRFFIQQTQRSKGSGAHPRHVVAIHGKRQLFCFAGLIVARLAVGVCDLLLAISLYLMFQRLQPGAIGHESRWIPKTVLSTAIVASILAASRALVDIASSQSLIRQTQGLYTSLMSRLIEGYFEMRWGQFVLRNRSEMMIHSVQTAREAANYYHYCVELISSAAIVLIMTLALLRQSPVTAIGLGAVVAVFYAVHRFSIRERVRSAAASGEEAMEALQKILSDMFSSGKEIRTYSNHGFFFNRVRQQASRVAESNLRIALLPQMARILADQGVMLLFLSVILVIQWQYSNPAQLLSLLAFYFVLSRRLLPLISHISFMAGHMQSSYESVKIIRAELNECVQSSAPRKVMAAPRAGYLVEMEAVSFCFEDQDPILRDVHFHLSEGEIVLLLGPSGSGKTTLLNLIAGVSQPESGTVRGYARGVAYVPQEIALLDDSIRSNLLFGLPDKGDAELMRALVAVEMDAWFASTSSGLETRVGENGILLSGGERQRLGLARAILRDVSVLLLDEATSALDEPIERRILENLSASGKAIVMVTHRRYHHKFAQSLYRLKDGRLTKQFSTDAIEDQEKSVAGMAR